MESLNILLDIEADGGWPDLDRGDVLEARLTAVGALKFGTASGKPVVMLRLDLDDGRTVVGQVTLRLLASAVDAFVSAHGDPRYDDDGRVEQSPSPSEVTAGYLAVCEMAVRQGMSPRNVMLQALPAECPFDDVAGAAIRRANAYTQVVRSQAGESQQQVQTVAGAWLEGFYIGQAWRDQLERATRRGEADDG